MLAIKIILLDYIRIHTYLQNSVGADETSYQISNFEIILCFGTEQNLFRQPLHFSEYLNGSKVCQHLFTFQDPQNPKMKCLYLMMIMIWIYMHLVIRSIKPWDKLEKPNSIFFAPFNLPHSPRAF